MVEETFPVTKKMLFFLQTIIVKVAIKATDKICHRLV